MKTFTCTECGQTFTANGERRFCGRACANRRRGRSATLSATYRCERCGTEVTTKPRYLGKYRFCSDCRNREHGARLNEAAVSAGRRQDPVTLICEQCQQSFTVLACFAKGSRGQPRKFCSQRCNGASRVGRPSLTANGEPREPATGASLGIGGWRPDLGLYVRSRWEANYARSYRALESQIAKIIDGWEYPGDPEPSLPPRRCPTCETLIQDARPRGQFCSRECSNVRYRKPKEDRSCAACGAAFSVSLWESARRFCSKPCADRGKAEKIRQQRLGQHHSDATKRKISQTKRAANAAARALRQSAIPSS